MKKKWRLSRYFAVYAIKIIGILAILAVALIVVINLGISTGILRQADYEQQLILEITPQLSEVENITADMIPSPLEYILTDTQGTKIIDYGNMRSSAASKALAFLTKDGRPSGWDNPFFQIIEGKNQNCIIRYRMSAQFVNTTLRRWIPAPEVFFMVFFFLLFIVIFFLTTKKTTKRLTKELDKILKTAQKIKENDLEFESEKNRFMEFAEVAESLDKLRDALKLSLHEQITLEQLKTEQIQALAHDIKIPVTIIKGNAQLLSMMDQENREITDDLVYASDQVEIYVQNLIESVKLSTPKVSVKTWVSMKVFIEELEKEIQVLSRTMKCHVEIVENISHKSRGYFDPQVVERAILNILMNGIDQTIKQYELTSGENVDKERLKVELKIEEQGDYLSFSIQDYGTGFSKEALKHGTTLFFTEDKARAGKHHGIGLYFANQVAKDHGGRISMENKAHGAVVTLKISNKEG